MIKSFMPLIDKNTRILIIGTMPGVVSLKAGEYYAHKQNAFWKIMAKRFNNECEWLDYTEKKNALLKNGIGLWDSLQSCNREGSLDSDIKNPLPNNFGELFATYPNVQKLLFNGQKAFVFFKKYHDTLLHNYDFAIMPSTSPANASVSFAKKYQIWENALIVC